MSGPRKTRLIALGGLLVSIAGLALIVVYALTGWSSTGVNIVLVIVALHLYVERRIMRATETTELMECGYCFALTQPDNANKHIFWHMLYELHREDCKAARRDQAQRSADVWFERQPCTCGLDAAIAAEEKRLNDEATARWMTEQRTKR